jgi:PBSX family phage terminase large subunit
MAARIQVRFVPQPAQLAYIDSPADITVFGGARGGGKTYASLGDFWLHAEEHGKDARGLMVRKTRTDLKDTIHTAIQLYGNAAQWREHGSYFDFGNGARFYMAFLENERDAQAYQGWSLTRCYLEEITQFSSLDPMLKLLATLRSSAGIRCQMKATCNPGGPAHFAVKAMFIDNGPFNLVRDQDTGLTRVFIPSRVKDNPALLEADPGYVNRLKAVGSPQLVRAWLEGDWDVVEGSFFPEFDRARHVISAFPVPAEWIKFRSMDWGSAAPFAVSWWAVCQDTFEHDGRLIPRSAIVNYREWYGAKGPDEGLKMTAQEVARGIVARETDERGKREFVAYGVLDPAAFAVISGPSIAETLVRNGVPFRRADNTRVARDKRMGGHDQVRARLKGNEDGQPTLFMFSHCRDLIRTLPMLQHDPGHPEDLDSDSDDHCYDACRYACMSRPFLARRELARDRNPYLVANAFKLHELK